MSKVTENPDEIDISQFITGNENVINPLDLLNVKKSNTKSALLVLNQNITMCHELFKQIWANCDLHICADGGSNQLRKFDPSYTPDFIIGDLDSITEETMEFYKESSVEVLLQSSQFFTDLDKALSLTNLYFNFNHVIKDIKNWDTVDEIERRDQELSSANLQNLCEVNVIILGAIGGRFDQTINAISKMTKLNIARPNLKSILLNPEHTELILLLPSGRTLIDYKRLSKSEELEIFGSNFCKSRPNTRNIGLLPLLTPSVITTHGLKWDVANWETSISGNVSSCNLQVGSQGVIVETKNPMFVNLEL